MSERPIDPQPDCDLCPRLKSFRDRYRKEEPAWFNAPVPSFGDPDAALLIVGLAPGLKGANKTGRPFTGDYAGNLLYSSLARFDFSNDRYAARPDDGLRLKNALITNAVRCVPPENKPVGQEMKNCRDFLKQQIAALSKLQIILALGSIAHNSVVAVLGGRQADYKFAHGAEHLLPGNYRLIDSYHCSRYNTNTGRLTEQMFHDVFRSIRRIVTS